MSAEVRYYFKMKNRLKATEKSNSTYFFFSKQDERNVMCAGGTKIGNTVIDYITM